MTLFSFVPIPTQKINESTVVGNRSSLYKKKLILSLLALIFNVVYKRKWWYSKINSSVLFLKRKMEELMSFG